VRTWTAALLVSAATLLPRLADACPMCASQQPGGVARIVALGLMILVPFSVAYAVFRALRRAGAATTEVRPASAAGTPPGGERPSSLRELSP